ncbi:hypothetical protein Pst134EA_007804 [Puccinia striiformis f. sp. tritici]|uniref:hypothetical protein n=1 Tax=Puccinia striiformis f. sp. tritici TaxID=168172 RepID=UPI0020081B16|nr:hypothetical protein Pst134EA_007804 [Puccinia striiformis f. sp. tritici]KAH9470557.1 hypothetical protein Pst134EA_007804 [Puccinia striiformis f. sp. tritici]
MSCSQLSQPIIPLHTIHNSFPFCTYPSPTRPSHDSQLTCTPLSLSSVSHFVASFFSPTPPHPLLFFGSWSPFFVASSQLSPLFLFLVSFGLVWRSLFLLFAFFCFFF